MWCSWCSLSIVSLGVDEHNHLKFHGTTGNDPGGPMQAPRIFMGPSSSKMDSCFSHYVRLICTHGLNSGLAGCVPASRYKRELSRCWTKFFHSQPPPKKVFDTLPTSSINNQVSWPFWLLCTFLYPFFLSFFLLPYHIDIRYRNHDLQVL